MFTPPSLPSMDPITPPPELRLQWKQEWLIERENVDVVLDSAWNDGFRAGVDKCVEWLIDNQNPRWAAALQEALCPKPKSQAEEALEALDDAVLAGDCINTSNALPAIRRALKRLQELEEEQ